MTIRPMRAADTAAGLRLCRACGWNQLAEDWRAFLDGPRGGGLLAEREGAAAGTVAWLRYGAFTWLSMMLVDPAARRTGVGTRLMEAALAELANEPCVRLDATPMGEPLYRRFGFEAEYELARLTATAPAAAGNTPPMHAGELAEILALDAAVFGADRSAVLTSFRRRAPALARTLRQGVRLRGYCFGRPGYRYAQLGPVVAEDEAAARELAAACLAETPAGAVALDVACACGPWSAALGFRVERPFLRMRRGAAAAGGAPARGLREFAIAGPEFG